MYPMYIRPKRVLILDGVAKECSDVIKDAGIEVVCKGKQTKEELLEEIQDFDGLIVRSATKVCAEVINKSDRLKIIGRAGTGVDNIDVQAATLKGIVVVNAPGGNTLSAAEHTCALICALSRNIPQGCMSIKEGKWERKLFMGEELHGKKLGILGLGRIGFEVAKRMESFGMEIIGYDPMILFDVVKRFDFKCVDNLDELWPEVDYITVHTPLIEQTKHLIGEETLKKCKPTVKIINVARGGIVDEKALLKAIQEGKCGGAALDVFENEPPTDFELIKHPKVIATPHLGASTKEAQLRVAMEIADEFKNMSIGNPLKGAINAPTMKLLLTQRNRAWMALGSGLATLALQPFSAVIEGNLEVKVISNAKEIFQIQVEILAAVQHGLLIEKFPSVNLISAPALCKGAGMDVKYEHNPGRNDEDSYLLVFIRKGDVTQTLVGKILNQEPHIFSWNRCNFLFGVPLSNNLLFFESEGDSIPGNLLEAACKSSLGAYVCSSYYSDPEDTSMKSIRTKDPIDETVLKNCNVNVIAKSKFKLNPYHF